MLHKGVHYELNKSRVKYVQVGLNKGSNVNSEEVEVSIDWRDKLLSSKRNFTSYEVARIESLVRGIKVEPQKIYSYKKNGRIDHIKVDDQLLHTPQMVIDYIDGQLKGSSNKKSSIEELLS